MTETETRKTINLGIGGILVIQEPAIVVTVLGSCVSLCLFDEEKKIAGINHYMLPYPHDGKPPNAGRFGQSSIPELLSQMIRRGAALSRINGKIFGGARMLSQISSFGNIAESNVEVAQKILKEQGIRIVASDVGGNRGRKILFHTDTGRVFVRQVGARDSL